MAHALYLASHAFALAIYALGAWRLYEAGAGFAVSDRSPPGDLARRLEQNAIRDLIAGVALSVAALCAWIFL